MYVGPHFIIKPRPPWLRVSLHLACVLPLSRGSLDGLAFRKCGELYHCAPSLATPSPCRAPHCGKVVVPDQCWLRITSEQNLQESVHGPPPSLFPFHEAGNTSSFREKRAWSRASAGLRHKLEVCVHCSESPTSCLLQCNRKLS